MEHLNINIEPWGTMEQIDFSNNMAACAVGRNVRTHNYAAHGAVVLDLNDGTELNFFHTEGPLQAVAISSNGKKDSWNRGSCCNS